MTELCLEPEVLKLLDERQKAVYQRARTWSIRAVVAIGVDVWTEQSRLLINNLMEVGENISSEIENAGFQAVILDKLIRQHAEIHTRLSAVVPPTVPVAPPAESDDVKLTFDAVKYMTVLLPTVPCFDGDITKFAAFRTLFERAVHKVPNLPKEIKYKALVDKLMGEARASLISYSSDGADYDELYSTLVQENSGKYRLARRSFASRKQIPPVKNPTAAQIEAYLSAARVWVRAMQAIPTPDLRQYLLFEALFTRLDSTLAEKFNRNNASQDEVPTVSSLLEFAEAELKVAQMLPLSAR